MQWFIPNNHTYNRTTTFYEIVSPLMQCYTAYGRPVSTLHMENKGRSFIIYGTRFKFQTKYKLRLLYSSTVTL